MRDAFGRWIRWRVNEWLEQLLRSRLAADREYLMIVPAWARAEMLSHLYLLKVEQASDRWAQRESEVSVAEWQRAMIDHGMTPGRLYTDLDKPATERGAPPR